MGVRGLTTFIAQNSNRYLKSYELHDTYLVIDGNNLAAQLYKWHAKCYDCFGGDYDKYEKTVMYFFKLLQECNITPLIIYDGGYENRKLKTVYERVKTRIRQARNLDVTTENSMTVFPLFLRELFVEITQKLGLKIVRCLVEADYEMACIARKLKCPVLSYDSDFFIFDVAYIPFNTFVMHGSKQRSDYKFVECKVYKVDYFLKEYGGIKKDCLPLLATLLGNDYIKASFFKNFYKHLKLGKRHGKNDQQRRIRAVVEWLRNEDFESALRKILGRVKQLKRKYVASQIMNVADSYICSKSELIKYLNVAESGEKLNRFSDNINIDMIVENTEGDVDSESEESSSAGSSDESPEAEKIMKPDDSRELSDLPKFFEDRYKLCQYPATFIDIIFHNRYIFIPQIEDFKLSDSCHNISFNIMSAIYKILSFENARRLKCINRSNAGKIMFFHLFKTDKNTPIMDDLEHLPSGQAEQCLYDVLEFDQKTQKIINDFPSNWRLFVISIIYWIRSASPKANNCHIYSLIMSAIILQLDIGYHRDDRKFQNHFGKDIKRIEATKTDLTINNKISCEDALKSITKDDSIMVLKETITYFQMNIKLRQNPRLYDHSIIHSFAQFQSCAFHIKYLNCVLGKPIPDYLISDFYNGTLIYNLTSNFLSRKNLDEYVRLFLQYSPGVYLAFVKLKMSIALTTESWTTNVSNKRKRKRNKSSFKVFSKDGNRSESSEEEAVAHYDGNNRFSLLSIVDKQ